MNLENWAQIKPILADALEREDTALRAAFVAHACGGNLELRREVEAFLREEAENLEKFANGAHAPADERETIDTNTARRIGAYQLVRELGHGGMGAVWLATRADDEFQQTAAIKLLKRGTDTDEVLRRFRAEREILARLQHPNIARLLDGGTTDDGLPYFVMEYVDGARVTDYAFAQNLTVRERVELFLKICGAVQFAHQNLIVHRDLKPANILVTAEGEPKLLDFGIARLLDPESDAADGALQLTIADHRRLTPAYASPEQVRGEAITTASDIYTLGAVLYELLTTQSPHHFVTTRPGPAELFRVIGEEDLRRPSLVAPKPEVQRRLRGDLDNIVLRAMAREPARRYASASGLAHDLRRHLDGRPVGARPDTFGYRTGKFISRNKVAVTAGAMVGLALAGGVASTIWQARRAERRFGEVRRLTNSVLFEINDAIHDLPGSTPARQLIVNRALEYLDRLAQEAGGDKALQLELGEAYLRVGDVQGKPYTANLGDAAGALRSYSKAAEIAAPVAAGERGKSSAARRLLSNACESLGGVQSRLRQWNDAERSQRQSLALREQLLHDDPAHAQDWQRGIVANRVGLGDCIVSANRFHPVAGFQHAAIEEYRQALAISEQLAAGTAASASDSWWLAKSCARVATELSEVGAAENNRAAFSEALALHLRALSLDEAALRAEPMNGAVQRTLADELIALGYLRSFSHDDLGAGREECRRAQQIMENLAASDPANAEARQDLSSVHFVTARVLQAGGDLAGAVQSYRACLAILEPLVALHPDNVETSFDLERARQGLAEAQRPDASAAAAE